MYDYYGRGLSLGFQNILSVHQCKYCYSRRNIKIENFGFELVVCISVFHQYILNFFQKLSCV